MPARPGPSSQEGYPSSPPSTDAHSNDPFNSSNNRRYYDNESDGVDYPRREYRDSDTSHPPGNDYDNNDYRESTLFYPPGAPSTLVSFFVRLLLL